MNERQGLGGTRHGAPLDDEMSYPLTHDEYLTVRENLSIEKFTNWEAILISTLITTLISGVVIWYTGSFEKTELKNGIQTVEINMFQVVTLIMYGAISFGCILSLILARINKQRLKSPMERLNEKIINHLNKLNK